MAGSISREGSLDAPTRHPIDWQNPEFYNEDACFQELERVFDICHGCRRCVSLCQAFPTLFDLVDESDTLEVDGVVKQDYWQVVDQCYLCDLCYLTKCPYVPPHEWNVDFPHLMLRAKAIKYQKGDIKGRDKLLTSTDRNGRWLGIPVIAELANSANKIAPLRKILETLLQVHADALLPAYASRPLRKKYKNYQTTVLQSQTAGKTTGKVALFATCYANYNEPSLAEDLLKVFEHNEIAITLVPKEVCCGMPKYELGDLQSLDRLKQQNIPSLINMIDEGWDIVAPIPSCVLMFKQELPLMYPDDQNVQRIRRHIFDPFEYLMLRHKQGLLKTDFKSSLGTVAYQVACHQRVQNIGPKTRDVLALVPDTEVTMIERCSGHDGTYAIKKEFHQHAMKIAKPVANKVKQTDADYYTSDCAMAGRHIQNALNNGTEVTHPLSLLKAAYGLE